MEEQEGGSGAWMEEEGDWEKSLSRVGVWEQRRKRKIANGPNSLL